MTPDYITYNRHDVPATWELFQKFREEYERHLIPHQATKAYSPASIGKAYLYDKPILPLLLVPTEFPSEVEYVLAGRQWVEVLAYPVERWFPHVLGAVRRLVPVTDGGAT